MKLDYKVTFNETLIAGIAKIPSHFVAEGAEKILKAMARPIIIRAKQIAPSSRATGDRNKWSNKYKLNPAWQGDSGQHLGYKFRRSDGGGILIIGGVSPDANKLNFNHGKGRHVFFWGVDQGYSKVYRREDRFMLKAMDETKTQQLIAGNLQLETELGKVALAFK